MACPKLYADVEYLGKRYTDAELDNGVWCLDDEDTGTIQHVPHNPAINVLSPLEELPGWRRIAPRPGGLRGGSGSQ